MKMDWPTGTLPTDDDVALRNNRRDSMFLKAAIHCDRMNHSFDIVVRNVSAGGMLADTTMGLLHGDIVKVDLRNVGQVPGRVVWVQDGRFGVAFDVIIDPQAVRQPLNTRPTASAKPTTFVSRLSGKTVRPF